MTRAQWLSRALVPMFMLCASFGATPVTLVTDHSDPADNAATAVSTTTAVPPAPCVGDGVSGRRVMLFYARLASDANAYTTAAPAIRTMAASVNDAWRTVAGKNVLWRCTSGAVSVTSVVVTSLRLSACRTALQTQGFTRTDRIYVCFMRASADGYGGQAEVLHNADAKVSPSKHDTGPRYATVYSLNTSAAGTFMHEFGHTLGAVQCSAPHSSCPSGELGHHHCYEEQDVMCYSDGGSYFDLGGLIINRCLLAATIAARWDCGKDDYFSANPAGGSYLATHWNTRDSLFLQSAS